MREESINISEKIVRQLDRMRGRPVEWDVSPYAKVLEKIDSTAEQMSLSQVTDSVLQEHARKLKITASQVNSLNELQVEAFALVRETSSRTLGMRHFDVQMIAGIALQQERFVEMQTGEGKTLVAVLPAFLSALQGRGVHILTFNDYLARRDALWMKPIYEFLGLSVAYVVDGMQREQRKVAYRADVTYLTAREAGYDFLRQSLARDKEEIVMRPFHMAIVDEADSILIDEARVPMVIAGRGPFEIDEDRIRFATIAARLKEKVHFSCDENSRNVYLTKKGIEFVQKQLGCQDLINEENRDALTLINQALYARALLKKDVDYIVRDGRVEIVDEFTGRVVQDRHWPDGLQRAVEAKEQVALKDQGRILNSITIQHFMDLYPKLCGMSGTIIPSEEELHHFYHRRTVVIPSNKPCIRTDHQDKVFTHANAKIEAVLTEVKTAKRIGKPILIGTSSVEESEHLAALLKKEGILCRILNAKNDAEEARLIAEAGAPGAVTVSTNMAGRGTDIRLGGEDERQRDSVVRAGGLYVIGTNRYESRRVDNQLRGRAGRQGDPGASRFFLSLDDPLMERFGVKKLIPKRHQKKECTAPVDDSVVHNKIALVQRIVEGQNFDIRKTLWDYTSFVEKQRRRTQAARDLVLLGHSHGRLVTLCPEKYKWLQQEVDQRVLDQIETQIVLFHMDRCWMDYLDSIADIREGIYLRRLGGQNPLAEFFRMASDLYTQMEIDIDRGIADTFNSVTVTKEGIDIEKEGLKGPSCTWTYLVNDNPFEWLGSLTEISNVGYGIATGLYFGFFFILQALYKKLLKSS